jgi:hypothetical protein
VTGPERLEGFGEARGRAGRPGGRRERR